MFTWLKRLFIRWNLIMEKASETDAYNEAVVENGIREQKAKANTAHEANGRLMATIMRLREQVKQNEKNMKEKKYLIDAAVKQNDEANGAIYAEEMANLESDLSENKAQLTSLEDIYKNNTQIIAESIRYIQKAQREFESLKARVAMSRNMEGLAQLMKSSVTELQGIMGGDVSSAMERMRNAAVIGQAQITNTMDLAKEMGANIRQQQEARKTRGKALFEEYKAKAQANVVTPVTEATPAPFSQNETKQKIAAS